MSTEQCQCPSNEADECYFMRIGDDEDGRCTCACHSVDRHDAGAAALWLDERAKANREIAALPREDWPYHPDVQRHFALRFGQIAELLRSQRGQIFVHQTTIASLRTAVLQAQHERDCAVEHLTQLNSRLNAIPSPSALCALLGCRLDQAHVHQVLEGVSFAVDVSERVCCHKCAPQGISYQMIMCPDCGNKRCPKASDHNLACTNSNEPGQPGSVY